VIIYLIVTPSCIYANILYKIIIDITFCGHYG
jgi:hypothetical protein